MHVLLAAVIVAPLPSSVLNSVVDFAIPEDDSPDREAIRWKNDGDGRLL
jgi:hypothetical protein